MGRPLRADPGGRASRDPLEVRPATEPDADAIGALCAAGFAASSEGLLPAEVVAERAERFYAPARVAADLGPRDDGWLGYVVAVADGRVVGAAGGSVDREVGHLLVLYVDLRLIGCGVGHALLAHVSDQQRGRGVTRQRVTVTEGNEMGLPFYRRQGFGPVDRHLFGPETGTEVWSLVLERPL